ncbi:late blight resistance protein R1-A-like isoform X1 [Nicotiana tomentosiformis]|uniref:late blight resistance protein R1-A-like isoform X1 n=2 Tax=Nicotiana tomentosiformis TaxID=4098 RepID=UPI00388C42F2
MFLDKDLSKTRRDFLEFRPSNIDDVSRDRLEFFLWELNFLDSFLSLQCFTFAGECGMLDVSKKMKEIWKKSISVQQATQRIFFSDSDWEGSVDPNFDPFTSNVPTGIWKSKLEFQSKYSFAQVSSILLPANKDDIPTPKFLMEFLDGVIENLNVLLQIDDPRSLLYVPEPKEQLKEVLKELNLLRFFVCFVSNKCTEPAQSEHTFFTHVLIVSSHAAMVAWLYLPVHCKENQDVAPGEMNALISNLLQMKIRPIQPGIRKIYTDVLCTLKSITQPGWHPNIQNKHVTDSGFVEAPAHNLMKLPTVSNPSGRVSSNDQMAILQDMLSLIRANLIHLPILDLEFCLQDMDTVIVDAGLLIYSLYDSEGEKEGMTLEDVNQALGLDLPGNIQPVKAMIYLIIRKAFQSNLPRIHGLGYVDFFLNNLKEFQSLHSDSLATVMNQLQIIQKELESLQSFLKAVAEQQYDKHDRHQIWATQLISKAYEVEYVVDACISISKEVPHWCLQLWLLDIIKEISCIKAEMQEMLCVVDDTMNTTTDHKSSQLVWTPKMKEQFVGLEDVRMELRDKLTKGYRQLDIISIVGMPGLGKTTLAKEIYYDESVIEYFDIRAQCCVSQVYKRMDLILEILHDAIGESPSFSTVHDAAEQLRRTLMRKRYLILVDDVWETSAWDDLRPCFYDANNGSKIILTTRHLEVANYAKCVSFPIPLRMFNDDESWKLLEDRVFGEERCSPSLEEVGRQIAKKCGGLPLSIVVVAGILAKMEKKEESWKQVATRLSSHIQGDTKAIVELSYQNLPYHLKPCFLYFGAFLEDRVIDVSRLTKLWTSEGFIKSCESRRLEDIAEGYLENLIGKNLVFVAKRSSDGKVEACRLHDVMLDFCKEKATEENLLLWIIRDQNANPSSNIYSRKQHVQRRLAFREVDNLEEWSSSCSLVGSVLFRSDTDIFARLPIPKPGFTISRILQNFKFLKVLDLEHCIVIDFFPTDLVYMRYFSAEIDQNSIPTSIANLSNLETLVLKSRGQISLPVTLRRMVKLRHLHIAQYFTISNAEKPFDDDSLKFYDLDTLSQPYFSCVEDVEVMLRKAPNIREMECKFKGFCSSPFPVLDFSTQLETLHIIGEVLELQHRYPVCISASNLKILKLSIFRLGHEHLSNIGQLQNLQVLELLAIEFDDEEWEVNDDEFPELRVLILMFCRCLEEWDAVEYSFPNLERLFLRGLENLKEIPSCFIDSPFLQSIEVRECNESVVKSARFIQELQFEDYQNANLNLYIYPYSGSADNL